MIGVGGLLKRDAKTIYGDGHTCLSSMYLPGYLVNLPGTLVHNYRLLDKNNEN